MKDNHFEKVKNYVLDLDFQIVAENAEDGVIVINDEESGINRLVLGIADPLLIIEQYIVELKNPDAATYQSLLAKNRDIIHGAFALDESGKKVLFRDTLQLENLDFNEIEASLNSLALLLSEYSDDLVSFAHS